MSVSNKRLVRSTDKKSKDKHDLENPEVVEFEVRVEEKCWKSVPGVGFGLIFVALLVQNGQLLLVKTMTSIDPLVLLFYRSIFIFLVTMPWAVIKDKPPFPPQQSLKDRFSLLYRGIIGCLNMWAGYYSVRYCL